MVVRNTGEDRIPIGLFFRIVEGTLSGVFSGILPVMRVKIHHLSIVVRFVIRRQVFGVYFIQGIQSLFQKTGGCQDERLFDLPLCNPLGIVQLLCYFQIFMDITKCRVAVIDHIFFIKQFVHPVLLFLCCNFLFHFPQVLDSFFFSNDKSLIFSQQRVQAGQHFLSLSRNSLSGYISG